MHVVDDDEAFRRGYAMNLQAEGLPVRGYPGGEEFLATPLWPRRGVVSLDIDLLPGRLDGLQVFERLLAERCPMPVVFLTGPHDKDVRLAVSLVTRREDVEFFPKHPVLAAGPDEQGLIGALRRFLQREPQARAEAADERALLQGVLADLTPAERRVLNFLVADRGIKSFTIACELGKKEGVIELQRLSGQRKLLGEGRSRPSVAERVGPLLQRYGVRDLDALARHELRHRLALLPATARRVLLLLAGGQSEAQVARRLAWPEDEPPRVRSERLQPLLQPALAWMQADSPRQVRRWFLALHGHVPDPDDRSAGAAA